MKLRISFHDPDAPYDAVVQACREQVNKIEGIDETERATLLGERIEKMDKALRKWLVYGEYIVVEFDIEAGTAEVVPSK